MKAATKAFLIMLIILFYFMSCKKNEGDPRMKTATPSSGSLTAQARAFFDKEFATPVSFNDRSTNKENKRKTILKTPEWDKSYTSKTTKGELVIVPLKFSEKIRSNVRSKDAKKLSLENFTNLYIYKGDDGAFKAEVIYKIPNSKYLSEVGKKYSGEMIIEDWHGNAVASYHIDEGKYFKLTPKDDQGRMDPTYDEVVCVYLDHWNCKRDEHTNQYYDCQLLYSEFLGCYGGDEGGGGNPYGDNTEVCQMPAPEDVLAAADAVSEPGSSHAGPELFNAQGDRTRTVYVNWRFYRGTFLTYDWGYISHDIGTQTFADGDSDWKWKTYNHVSESETGFVPPRTTMSLNMPGLSEISPDRSRASMKLHFTVKMCVICSFWDLGCKSQFNISSSERGVHV